MTKNQQVPRDQVNAQETWDMTLLYPSDTIFKNELSHIERVLPQFKTSYENRLNELETLDKAFTDFESLLANFYRLGAYATLPTTVDRFNETVIDNANRYQQASAIWAASTSFFDSELATLSDELLDQFVAEKRPDLAYVIEKIKRDKKHRLSKDAEQVLSNFRSLPDFYDLYEITKFEDMDFESFTVDGKDYENSYVSYENLHEMDNNTEIRRKAADSFYKTLRKYKNTTANEYISHIKKEKLVATMRGYDSVIDYLLDQQDGNRDLYDRQINLIMEELAPHIRRYMKLLAREHQINDMQFADCKINLDPDYEVDMTIPESRDYLKKALAVLGEDYGQLIDESYDKRWTDFPQNIGKSTGGFCYTIGGVAAFILLSWTGKMNEVFVLAHELGHAYHFMYCGEKQSMMNQDCSLYFVEAPSTCNEVLVSNYLLKTSSDARFKRWVISNMISRTYYHNMVTHYLEAVFQDRVYKKLDAGDMFTADILSTIKKEVMQEFFGDSLEINDGAELTWMRQPHYYMGLYPYTYSAGLTIGTAVANKIEEDPSHAQVWLDTLGKGGSMSALDLCQAAGCDVSTDKPLKDAIAYVGSLVDQLYKLTDELK